MLTSRIHIAASGIYIVNSRIYSSKSEILMLKTGYDTRCGSHIEKWISTERIAGDR